jgi:hypothetical protein
MAQIVVRKLEDEVKDGLRRRAARLLAWLDTRSPKSVHITTITIYEIQREGSSF